MTKTLVQTHAGRLLAGLRTAIWGLIVACVAVYVVSFALPAVKINDGDQVAWGIFAAIGGVLALAIGQPAVLANPALWAGLVFARLGKWKHALVLGLVATVLALSPLTIYQPGSPQVHHSPCSPGLIEKRITELPAGYYFWVASFAIFTFASAIAAAMAKRTSPAATGREPAASPAARIWTDATGQFTVEAALVAVKDGKVLLIKANGSVLELPLSKLSVADEDYLRSLTEVAETC
jgi:hypothetical protein